MRNISHRLEKNATKVREVAGAESTQIKGKLFFYGDKNNSSRCKLFNSRLMPLKKSMYIYIQERKEFTREVFDLICAIEVKIVLSSVAFVDRHQHINKNEVIFFFF